MPGPGGRAHGRGKTKSADLVVSIQLLFVKIRGTCAETGESWGRKTLVCEKLGLPGKTFRDCSKKDCQ